MEYRYSKSQKTIMRQLLTTQLIRLIMSINKGSPNYKKMGFMMWDVFDGTPPCNCYLCRALRHQSSVTTEPPGLPDVV